MTRALQPGQRLCLATHNAGKLREVRALLAPWGIDVVSAGELELPAPAETADSFAGNAAIKAVAAARGSGLPALADDSGLCVAALGGDPGVRTADWAERPDGTRDYNHAMATVARRAGDAADRRAWFSCTLVLAWPDGHQDTFVGECHGEWVFPPRGPDGFGYDPMFRPDGEARTFGEMTPAEKARFSHRARAFERLAAACLPDPAG